MIRIAGRPQTSVVLLISPPDEDHNRYRQILDGFDWAVRGVSTCREAMAVMSENQTDVVICEQDLPDGNWKDVLKALTALSYPPALIVTSRLADELLWAEVLNLGGYDVLAKPPNAMEVFWAVISARDNREHQSQRSAQMQMTIA